MNSNKKYDINKIIKEYNKFYKNSNIYNFTQFSKSYKFIKINGTSQKLLIEKNLNDFYEKVNSGDKCFIKLNMMYENKKVDYTFGKFTQIWIYNPPKNIFETYVDLYRITDRGRFCFYYNMEDMSKSCIVIELSGDHIQTIKKDFFSGIEKTIDPGIYEREIKDINHYAYYIKYFDDDLLLKKGLNITYGQNTDYHNYKPVNDLALLDMDIPNDKEYLISRYWY